MTNPNPRTLYLVCLFAIALMAFQAIQIAAAPLDALAVSDNDDILRYLQVKAWFEGQSWFDARMYRMLAPEGLDLHWSRYVDLGIAAVIWPLTFFMPFDAAGGIALMVWPTLLLAGLVIITAHTAMKTFGAGTGVLAILAVALWFPTGQAYFASARIDHHNLQIVLTTILIFTLILPGRPLRLGIVGGIVAALSLAVGLELLFTIAVAGLMLALRAIWQRGAAQTHFYAFICTLALAAPLFYAGQTTPALWGDPRCDVLSTPYLALTTLGALATGLYALVARRLEAPLARFGVLAALFGGGIVVLLPILTPCLEGPYGVLPQDVQDIIYGAISEARPAWGRLLEGDDVTFVYVVPPVVATLVGTAIWGYRMARGMGGDVETRRLGTLLIFGWLGLAATSGQLRLILAGAGAYPMLIGYCLATLLSWRTGTYRSLATLGFAACAAITLFASAFLQIGVPAAEAAVEEPGRTADSCRDPEILRSLAVVPPARIFATANISAPMMLLTAHTGLTGPYHRNPNAMADGLIPFARDEAVLRDALERTQADYLLLCRDARFWSDTSFATQLAAGGKATWLAPVTGLHEDLLLFKVR